MDKTDACTGRVCLDLEQLQVMQGLNKAVVLYLSMNVNLGVAMFYLVCPKLVPVYQLVCHSVESLAKKRECKFQMTHIYSKTLTMQIDKCHLT